MPPAGLAGRPDHDALLAAVIADPDADLPRLVYADYLEEAGDGADAARAEFIRLQCSIAERGRTERVAEGDAGWERAAELADDYGAEWRRRMPSVAGVVLGFGGRGGVGSAWRGFPEVTFESVAVIKAAWKRLGPVTPLECVGLATLVQRGMRQRFAGLPGRPYRVVRLPVSDPESSERFAELLAGGGPRPWRGLILSGAGPESLERLAETPNLPALEWLRFLVLPGARDSVGLAAPNASPSPPRMAWLEARTHLGKLLHHRAVRR